MALLLTDLPTCRLTDLHAQSLTIAGRLLRINEADTVILPGQWIVAHRITEQAQGPVDSQRTDGAGRFRFVMARPESGAVYVVSSRWQGIGYFSEPVPATGAAAPLALAVFDTSVTGPPLHIGIRHVVITRADNGGRRVLDIFQVENSQRVTRVGRDSTQAVWSAPLPAGIESPQAGESDIPASAISFANGRVAVAAPFPPGAKQVVINYRLPAGVRRLDVPVDQPLQRLEILVDDSTATASDDLVADEPVAIEGRTFRRYAADSLAAGASPGLSFAGGVAARRNWSWIAIALAGLALALGATLALRRRPAALGAAPVDEAGRADAEFSADSDQRLVAQLAALDEKFADREAGTPAEVWANYQQRRAALKAELERRVARR